jgi:preprotein translocase subunit SecD
VRGVLVTVPLAIWRILVVIFGDSLRRRVLLTVSLAVIATASLVVQQFDVNLLGVRINRDNDGPLGLRLGLDLQGGIHLVYQAVLQDGLKKDGTALTPQDMEGVRQTIERRVNPLGVAEPGIQLMGDNRIVLQLPGIEDIEQVKRLIGETASLNFKIREFQPDGTPVDTALNLTGDDVERAFAGAHSQTSAPIVNIEFNRSGAQTFGEATARITGTNNRIVIFLDDVELVAPVVEEAILGGQAFIQGPDFTPERVQTLAIQLESGRLPVPIEVIQEWSVDATLGADSLAKSLTAGLVGLALVLGFMFFYYRLPGFMAGIALVFYSFLLLSIFKVFNVTLTLSGVAAVILSIGMAIDANILIFERFKEEVRGGRTLRASVEVGFNRAWPAIRDSNVSTLITCIILMWFGTRLAASLVLGFALTLGIGVLVSMFTAIFVTRTLLQSSMLTPASRHLGLFVSTDNIPKSD